MKILAGFILLFLSMSAFAVVEKSGTLKVVQIWGSIAKTSVCSSESSCVAYWVSLNDSKGQAVYSTWLAAKLSQSKIYIQGYDPDNDSHPYSGASKFYGMTLK